MTELQTPPAVPVWWTLEEKSTHLVWQVFTTSAFKAAKLLGLTLPDVKVIRFGSKE